MAVAALEAAVLTRELVTGLDMIETVDPVRPVNELEGPSSVFAVAIEAFLLAGRRDPIVISLTAVYTHRDLLVTLQTLLVAGSFSKIMTLETFAHTLEKGVRLRQLAR